MKIKIALVLLLLSLTAVRADDAIANAQQALKDQGFYYGEITGQKDTVTTDAVRRYQIRNGLQINGELNEETLRSLKSTAASAQQTTPAPAPAPANADTSDLRDESARGNATARSEPVPPLARPAPDREQPPAAPGTVVPSGGGLFAGTPYESAPPDVQRKVIVDAQKILASRGLFKNEVDGFYGPSLEFSLRAYQSRVGLRPTGRLDLETLAALELLPGAHMPVVTPRRGVHPPPDEQPPVRGEWVRP